MVRYPSPERTCKPVQITVHRNRQDESGHAKGDYDFIDMVGDGHGVELSRNHQAPERQHGHHQVDDIERGLTQHLPGGHVHDRTAYMLLDLEFLLRPAWRSPACGWPREEQRRT